MKSLEEAIDKLSYPTEAVVSLRDGKKIIPLPITFIDTGEVFRHSKGKEPEYTG